MYIQCNQAEFKKHKETFTGLPESTMFSVRNTRTDKPMYSYTLMNGEFELVHDYVERDRKWRKGECEEFTKKNDSLNKVIKYFVEEFSDNDPYREYKVMCELEYKHMTYCRHAGSRLERDEMKSPYNIFTLWIKRDHDINKAFKEVAKVIKAQHACHGEGCYQSFNIMSYREDSWRQKLEYIYGEWFITNGHGTSVGLTLMQALKNIQTVYWNE